MELLFKMLMAIYPMSEGLMQYLRMTLEVFEPEPGEYLLKKGQVSTRIYFVAQGILRCYYEDEKKRHTTKWLFDEGNVLVAVGSFFNQTPSLEAIQALENCVLFGISYAQLQEAYKRFIEFNYHGRVLTERYYVMHDSRILMFQRLKAQERYEYTLKTQPGIVDRPSVTAGYLSSYLGITQETLSRIKGKI